jgi:TPR repeat protein
LKFDSNGIEMDEDEALRLIEQGCKTDHGESCYYLGVAAETDRGRAKDLNLARVYYENGCKFSFEKACEVIRKYKAKSGK